ncbi:hypothetical protein PHMEG_0006606 [Phytophthora megakarya]|uniref:Uncharacterized protein n=1 Tax=Phytophthora megakarya TaxID=4795 RepID=A0A225WNL3_9STRA|nr:hypothetical protein PHMEG_0006606 [Phytophthora megakarya]
MGRKQPLVELVGVPAAVEELGYPHERPKLRAFKGNKLGKTTKGQGRKNLSFHSCPGHFHEGHSSRERVVGHLPISKKSLASGRRALEWLLQRTANRNRKRLSYQVLTCIGSSLNSHWNFGPRYKVSRSTHVEGRMTAVLTIRADGGAVDPHELDRFLVDTFTLYKKLDGWTPPAGRRLRVVAEEACATVVPLSTKKYVDVGVMGPLKATIRSLYIPKKGLTVPEKRLRAIKATMSTWEKFPAHNVIRIFKATTLRYESTTRKREALTLAEEVGVKASSEQLKFAKGTIYDWRKQAEAIWSLEGHSTSKTLKGRGRREYFLVSLTFNIYEGFLPLKNQAAKHHTRTAKKQKGYSQLNFGNTVPTEVTAS